MKCVLVYVGVGVAGFNSNRPIGDREGSWIGHGIASIGASVKAAGHETELIDLRHLGGWEDVIKRIAATPANVYCLSVSPVDGQFAEPIAQMVKYCHPQARVLAGGIHPTLFSGRYGDAIDTLVIGEGEVTVVRLLDDMAQGKAWPRTVKGIQPDLDALPWVDRELFDYRREMDCFYTPDQRTPSITMLAGRGCPFLCNYCQPAENAVFGKPYRIRSPQNVVAEMAHLKAKYDYKSVTFWDDTFTLNRKWVMEFCDRYEAAGIGATIAACSRADIICNNEAMVKRLASVGVDWFVIGLESGSQRILDLIKKGVTVEQNLKAAEICRKYGIKIFGTFMYGLPTETRADVMATARMIDRIRPEHPSPFYFLPIEGTGLYDYCRDNGLLPDHGTETIERTGKRSRNVKGVDYDYIDQVIQGYREAA